MKSFFKKKSFWAIIITLVLMLGAYVSLFYDPYRNPNVIWGASFDSDYAQYLTHEPHRVFETILDEWKFRYLRISVHWDNIEKQKGVFDYSDLDWLMGESAKRNAKVILAIGQKTPRWPECHRPAWADTLTYTEYRAALKNFIATSVSRYKNHPALEIWQIENEPFFPFGLCPSYKPSELAEELTLVKQIDSVHPTLVTDSGELSTWFKTARTADLFGSTMYRVVWDKHIGYTNYDWVPAIFYRFKLSLAGRPLKSAYGVELQAEPWMPNRDFKEVSLSEQNKSMNLARLKKNIDYAERVGFPRSYLWGAEWWYWLKQQGLNDIPDYIKQLIKQP